MKKILNYIAVVFLSVGATYVTYNYLAHKNAQGESYDIYNVFSGQDSSENVHLASITAEGFPDFTKIAESSTHAVVHIKSVVKQDVRSSRGNQQMIDPFEYFFGFGGRQFQQEPQPREGFGSGVIISQDGYIITNNHVVDKANEIEVTLNDNSKYTAKLIGADPNTDIALIKIEGTNFPIIPFGNSDNLRVGEWVLAVGNPFNLTSTVTAGIVSAKARGGIGGGTNSIQSFIQTDAAINPGNSGGALVNTRGELVGINTAIYSQTGSFAGYGFAVPISIAGKVIADLKEYGAVQRAVLGVMIGDVATVKERNPEKTKDIKVTEGVFVDNFADRSPAKEAGILQGDVIVGINGIKVRTVGELQEQISKYRPGDKVKVAIKRGDSDKTIEVVLKNNDGNTSLIKKTDGIAQVGAAFRELSQDEKRKFGINYGVEVSGVDSKGKMKEAGITKGFIIMKINEQEVSTPEDVEKIIESASQSTEKGLFIRGFYPNGRTRFYAIDLGE